MKEEEGSRIKSVNIDNLRFLLVQEEYIEYQMFGVRKLRSVKEGFG